MREYCPYCYGLICPNDVCVNCNEPSYDDDDE